MALRKPEVLEKTERALYKMRGRCKKRHFGPARTLNTIDFFAFLTQIIKPQLVEEKHSSITLVRVRASG